MGYVGHCHKLCGVVQKIIKLMQSAGAVFLHT